MSDSWSARGSLAVKHNSYGGSHWLTFLAGSLPDNLHPEPWQAMSQRGLWSPALGSGCILTQDLVYPGMRESLSNRCHLPPVNPAGCLLSRCLFTPCCKGLVTHSHYGNCSMWLVSQEGSQPRHRLTVKEEVEIRTRVSTHLIWLYSLIAINFKMPSFNSTAGLP